jgi:hypothetical protein
MDPHRNMLVEFTGSNRPTRKSDVGVMIKYEGVASSLDLWELLGST